MSAGSSRIMPPLYLLSAIVLMVGLHRIAPGPRLIGAPLRYGGFIVMAAGIALILWPAGLFRRAGTTIRPFEVSSKLVVEGPYRLSRNPIYVGMVLILLGLGWVLGSLWPFLVVPAFALLIDRRFIRAEEAILEQTFGAEYTAYRSRVRRWV